ncbi:MAG TPA: hypothetical protein VL171_14605 [Verrucomicrobiae bacterium]|nr:hypothetical protein [Verrucomicrobiae bacterium]
MKRSNSTGLLQGARVYLSGPMDFVASRAAEKKLGWRNRVGEFLETMGVTVFDPWFKPDVRGLHEYGREDVKSGERIRKRWTYASGRKGAEARSWCARQFWETLHIDLRMVDTSDFSISYCPTNIYSVGTPHEIIMATLQHKPVLFVSPPVTFPTLDELREHLKNDPLGTALLERLEAEVPIKQNLRAIPSLWYIPLVGGENFFDGFGFAPFRKKFGWKQEIKLDDYEKRFPPKRPLLPFLANLNKHLPRRWDRKLKRFVPDDDWLLWDLKAGKRRGKHLQGVRR